MPVAVRRCVPVKPPAIVRGKVTSSCSSPSRWATITWLMLTALPSSTGSVGSRSVSSAFSSRAVPGVPWSTWRRSWSLPASASVSRSRSRENDVMFSDVVLLGAAARCQAVVEQRDRLVGVGRGLVDEPAAVVEQLLERLAGVVEHGPELGRRRPGGSPRRPSRRSVELDEQVGLVGRQRVRVALEPVAVLDVRALVVGRLEVEVLLADRRQVVDVHRRVHGQLGALLQRQRRASTPVAARVHRRDLADLDAAVGHLAALEQPAGRRQGRVDGDARGRGSGR